MPGMRVNEKERQTLINCRKINNSAAVKGLLIVLENSTQIIY